MDLKTGEVIVKTYHHHPWPFIVQLIKAVGASIPFFFILFLMAPTIPFQITIIAILAITALFSLVVVYLALIYWLDKLIITNKRVIFIDWKYLTIRAEAEALLYDVQDIHTQEQGVLSAFYLFDFGTVRLETASSKTTILFKDAPDPEGIKSFINDHIQACRPDASCDPVPAPSPIS